MLNRPGPSRTPAPRRKPAVAAAESAPSLPTAGRGPDLGRLENTLGYVLRRAQLAVFKSFQSTFRGVDITPAQISVLIIIERNPGLTHTQVADALGIKRANFVALFDKLETRRLVQRGPAADRRSHALHLTPRGQALLKRLHALSAEFEAKLSAPLGADGRETLIKLLNTLIAPLESGDAGEVED
jgi:DNA-binding MarR family transcriptional regulator